MARWFDERGEEIMTLRKEPIRILQVVTSLNPGGIENYLMNLYRNIDREVIQFDFLVHRSEPGLYEKEVEDLGGRIYRVPRANPLNPNYFASLNAFFSEHGYSVVHAHLDCMSAFVLKAAKKYGVTTRVAHSHSSSQDRDLKYPIKLLCKRLIPRYATDLFACGQQAGAWMFNGRAFSIKPNAIDLNRFRFSMESRLALRGEFSIPDNAVLMGHVGRFNPVKNQSFLLDVLKEALQAHKDAYLMLIGDGEQRQPVEERAKDLGVSERVRFAGVRNDVQACMSAFDIFAMPSLYEGLPLVLVEAQASGLQCLINDSIPADCDLTDLIVRLPLETSCWAEKIPDSNLGQQKFRDVNLKTLADCGFDINDAAAEMQKFYLDRSARQ